jgi:predicted membrane protein
MEKRTYDRRIWLGAGILVLGFVVLMQNLGVWNYNFHHYIFRWEVLLMVLGLFFILGDRNRSFGIILIILGGVFYFNEVLHLNLDFWEIFFPGILILIGVMIILRHYVDRDGERGTSVRDDNFLDELAIFGGGDRVVTSKEFRGGKVTTVFGGLNYDMIQAKLAPGKNYIDVFCIFGGMKIVTPGDWDIKIRVFSIFGGFGEKQRYFRDRAVREHESQLIIKGTVIFGGGEIKRFHE